jgi:hypothetical protein
MVVKRIGDVEALVSTSSAGVPWLQVGETR